MNPMITVAFGGLAVLAASTAFGQERSSSAVDTGYVFGAGPVADGFARDESQSPPLFTIGGVGVRVWAPMEPHYNGEANRDPAAESLWGPG
jgi:hypothetical protein